MCFSLSGLRSVGLLFESVAPGRTQDDIRAERIVIGLLLGGQSVDVYRRFGVRLGCSFIILRVAHCEKISSWETLAEKLFETCVLGFLLFSVFWT